MFDGVLPGKFWPWSTRSIIELAPDWPRDPPFESEASMDPKLRAAALIREVRALTGALGALALADLGPLALIEPDRGNCRPSEPASVGGFVLWVSGSLLVVMMAHGGLGMVVVPSWGIVPYVGALFAPSGDLVWAGTPLICSSKEWWMSRLPSVLRCAISLSKAVFLKRMSCRTDGTWPPYPEGKSLFTATSRPRDMSE
mmetsp:Transcript_142542/g.443278  ORF Transcript_142542/g.443278 Transcript_142542/m.443278 type:complete len:199 (+) Transcript_142542:123-719(+)